MYFSRFDILNQSYDPIALTSMHTYSQNFKKKFKA